MDIALVTGAGNGLGRAFAVGLAAAGAGVVVADVDRAAAEQTAALLPTPSEAVVADLRDPDEAQRLVRVAERRGGPHILVNNAGGRTPGGRQFPDAAPEEWLATHALNLTAPMLLSHLVLEPMRRIGAGAIVNVSSSGRHRQRAVRLELAAMAPDERARTRPLIPPEDIVDVGLGLGRDGRPRAIVEMRGGRPPHEQEPFSF